jgi:lipopolysaccharide export system permease protein
MRLLSRYLVRTLLAPFAFALVALTCMLLLNHISKTLPDLVGKGLAPQVIIEALVLSLPFIIALTMPMAVLVAVLYGFSQLAADSELTAMKATGISVSQMLRPVFIAGIVIALTNFFFVDQILPRSNARLKALRLDIARKKPTVALRAEAVNELPPSAYFLRASRIEAESGALRDVVLFDMGQAAGRRIIVADSGMMAFAANGQDLVMVLHHGRVHDYNRTNPGAVDITEFATNTILVRNVANSLDRSEGALEFGEREKSSCEMLNEVVWADRRRAQYHERLKRMAFHDLRVLAGRRQPDLTPVRIDTAAVQRCGPLARVDDIMKRILLPAPLEAQDQALPQRPAAAQEPGQDPRPPALPAVPQAPEAAIPDPVFEDAAEFELPQMSMMAEVAFVRSQYDEAAGSVDRYRVEIHKKFSISLACLNFVIIGIALALRWPRGGIGLVMGGSVLVFTVFYVGLTAGESFADRGEMPPALAMWLPNLIIFAAGAAGLARVSRYSGSTRGGDFAEMVEMLTGWLPWRRRSPA